MKAISAVIAVVLILLITISIAGLAYIFAAETFETTTDAGTEQVESVASSMQDDIKDTLGINCGDGECAGSETCETCIPDCGSCPTTCGDGNKEIGEACDSDTIDCSELSGYEPGYDATCLDDCSGYDVDDCVALPDCYDGDADGYHVIAVDCEGSNDCDDFRADINPGAEEICNNEDDDCDDVVDTIVEECGLGECAGGTRTCTAGVWDICSTAWSATVEICDDELDNDCDGDTDCDDSSCISDPYCEYCGNGVVETGEECDDGNNVDGDGCSSDCMLEVSCQVDQKAETIGSLNIKDRPAQSFIPTQVDLSKIEVYLDLGLSSQDLNVKIVPELSNEPDTANVLVSDIISVSSGAGWKELDITDVNLVPGDRYYIWIDSYIAGNAWKITNEAYSSGDAWAKVGTVNQVKTNYDLMFRTIYC